MSAQSITRPRRLPLARRQALLLEAQPRIERIARHYAALYRPHLFDADDLAQAACLACLEAMRRGLKAEGNKVAYLVAIARHTIRDYCGEYRGALRTPWQAHKKAYAIAPLVLSLEAPLSSSSTLTLLETLEAPPLYVAAEDDDGDAYNALYECYLDTLPL